MAEKTSLDLNSDQNAQPDSSSKKKKKTLLIIIGAIVALCIICLVISVLLGGLQSIGLLPTSEPTSTAEPTETPEFLNTPASTNTPNPTNTLESTDTPEPTDTLEPTDTPEPTPTVNPHIINRGTHLVGTDIMPGIYYGIAGNDLMDSCYWARLSDLSGDLGSIIANDNSIGQFYVEVKETDVAFEVKCEVINIEAVPEPDEYLEELEAGMYIIDRDIQPGLYKGQAGEDIMDSCYWARLRNVTGELGSIISNDNATGQFYIQVSPDDFALEVRCPVTLED